MRFSQMSVICTPNQTALIQIYQAGLYVSVVFLKTKKWHINGTQFLEFLDHLLMLEDSWPVLWSGLLVFFSSLHLTDHTGSNTWCTEWASKWWHSHQITLFSVRHRRQHVWEPLVGVQGPHWWVGTCLSVSPHAWVCRVASTVFTNRMQ